MEEQILYLRGTASGFYKPISNNQSGHYTFNKFDFQTVDIRNPLVVETFNFNELKIGLYHEFTNSATDVRVFINEVDFIQEPIDELLLTDIKIGEVISINSEGYHGYTATVYFKVKKKIVVAREKKDTILPRFKLLKSTTDSKKSDIIRDVEGKISNQPEVSRTVDTENKSFFNLLLGASIVSFIGFSVLYLLFGLNPITCSLPFFFFSSMLEEGLKRRFPSLNNALRTKRNFLNMLGWIVLLCAFYQLISKGFAFIPILFLVLGLGLILLSRTGRFLKFIGGLFSLFAIIALLSNLNLFDEKNGSDKDEKIDYDNRDDDKWEYKPEEVADTIFSKESDTIPVTYLRHDLKWNDNKQNSYQALLLVRKDHFNIVNIKRNQLELNSSVFRDYYHQLYSTLVNQNKTYLDSVVKEYARIGNSRNLNRQQFADMVVSSIQSIPYYLVHDLTHREADVKYGGFIREYHQTGKPCLDKVKFGVQAPVEFIGNFKGDCDTRSLFLFYLLSKFGYNVVMLGSEQYSHCIIGISGNYSGDFVSYNRLKYYVWETTATGYTPGNIPPACSNMRYWVVELAN